MLFPIVLALALLVVYGLPAYLASARSRPRELARRMAWRRVGAPHVAPGADLARLAALPAVFECGATRVHVERVGGAELTADALLVWLEPVAGTSGAGLYGRVRVAPGARGGLALQVYTPPDPTLARALALAAVGAVVKIDAPGNAPLGPVLGGVVLLIGAGMAHAARVRDGAAAGELLVQLTARLGAPVV